VFVLADDLGSGDLHCYGRQDVRTPSLDRLAREGVRFTQAYANGPECSPTRTGLLTGRCQQRVGGLECAIGTGNVGRYDDAIRLRLTHDLGLPASETSIARMVRDAGYATGVVGKWHLGYEDKFAPHLHGFDEAFYALGGGLDYFHHVELLESGEVSHVLRVNGKPVRRDGYFTDLVTDEAVRFIRQHAADRFFLYVAYTAPHAPYQGPQDFTPQPLPRESPLQDQSRGPRATYVAMLERLDQGVGQILQVLDDQKLAGNTVVMFMSDNGATKSGSNGSLSGYKGSTFEGGIRVPAMVRWPGQISPGLVSEQVCLTMDFSRSIVRLAGATPPAGRTFDGIDILERIQAGRAVEPRLVFWRQRRGDNTWWAVRDGSLKLVRRAKGAVREELLFDLAQDPGEQRDLVATRPDDVQRLAARLAEWEHDVQPTRGQAPQVYGRTR